MNALVEMLGQAWAQRVGWTLVHFLWQGALIAGLLWLALRLLARRSPQVRYLAACLAVLLMVAAPVVTFWMVHEPKAPAAAVQARIAPIFPEGKDIAVGLRVDFGQVPVDLHRLRTEHFRVVEHKHFPGDITDLFEVYCPSAAHVVELRFRPGCGDFGSGNTVTVSTDTALPLREGGRLGTPLSMTCNTDRVGQQVQPIPQTPAVSRLDMVAAWVAPAMPYSVSIWLAGVIACSIWHLGGWLNVQRLRRAGVLLAGSEQDNRWLSAYRLLAARFRLGRPVRLLKVARLAGPVVAGVLRPAVLIPAAIVTALTPPQIEAILAHELAHIRRHDYLVNLLQTLVETVLFYHPLVWWVSSRIRVEREHCCDDLAIRIIEHGQDARATHGRDAHATSGRHAYASALAALAEVAVANQPVAGRGVLSRLAPAKRVAPGAGMSLFSRIRRVMGMPESSSSRWTGALAGLVVLLGIMVAIAVYGCKDKKDLATQATTMDDAEARIQLVELVGRSLPKQWQFAGQEEGAVAPACWDEGKGLHLVWRHRQINPLADWKNASAGLAGFVHLWIMDAGYSPKEEKYAHEVPWRICSIDAADEMAAWRGRRVFRWPSDRHCQDWSAVQTDIQAALKATGTGALIPPATAPHRTGLAGGKWRCWSDCEMADAVAYGPDAIWFAKNQIWRYDVKTQRIRTWTVLDGLPSNVRHLEQAPDGSCAVSDGVNIYLWQGDKDWKAIKPPVMYGLEGIAFDDESRLCAYFPDKEKWVVYRWDGDSWRPPESISRGILGSLRPIAGGYFVVPEMYSPRSVLVPEGGGKPISYEMNKEYQFIEAFRVGGNTVAQFLLDQKGTARFCAVTPGRLDKGYKGLGLDAVNFGAWGPGIDAGNAVPGGLPRNVRSSPFFLVRDANKHIWSGVNRWDGRRWKVIVPPEHLPSSYDLAGSDMVLDEATGIWHDPLAAVPPVMRSTYDPATHSGWISAGERKWELVKLPGGRRKGVLRTTDFQPQLKDKNGNWWGNEVSGWTPRAEIVRLDPQGVKHRYPAALSGGSIPSPPRLRLSPRGNVWMHDYKGNHRYDPRRDEFAAGEDFEDFAFTLGKQKLSLSASGIGIQVFRKADGKWRPLRIPGADDEMLLFSAQGEHTNDRDVMARTVRGDRMLIRGRGALEYDGTNDRWALLHNDCWPGARFDAKGRRIIAWGDVDLMFDGDPFDSLPAAQTQEQWLKRSLFDRMHPRLEDRPATPATHPAAPSTPRLSSGQASSGPARPAAVSTSHGLPTTSMVKLLEDFPPMMADTKLLSLLDAAREGDLETVRKAVDGDKSLPRRRYRVPYVFSNNTAPNLMMYPWWMKRDGTGLLHAAAAGGQKAVVKYLLAEGADPSARDQGGKTPLHYLAAPPPLASVNMFKAFQEREELRRTAYAAYRPLMERRRETADLLLAKGADINAAGEDGLTPLGVAAMENSRVIADCLLKHGARLDLQSAAFLGLAQRAAEVVARDKSAINRRGDLGRTPMEIAAGQGDAKMVRRLIALGADVSGEEHHRPLACAVNGGNAEAVAALLKAGADANKVDVWDSPVLCCAAGKGNLDVVRLLVEAGARLDAFGQNADVPLYMAASEGHVRVLDYLLDKGADIDRGRKGGQFTPLMGAVSMGQAEAAQRLLSRGAVLDVFSASGLGLHKRLEQMLHADPALAGISDSDPQYGIGTPLHWAARFNHVEAAKVLLDAGADIDARPHSGWTPLHVAAARGYAEMTRLLLERGAFVDARESYAVHGLRTPLMCAIGQWGHMAVITLLLEHGANPNAQAYSDGGYYNCGMMSGASASEDRELAAQASLVRRYATGKRATVNDVVAPIPAGDSGAAGRRRLRVSTYADGSEWYLRDGTREKLLGRSLGDGPIVNDLRCSPDGRWLAVQRLARDQSPVYAVEIVDLRTLLEKGQYQAVRRLRSSRGYPINLDSWRDGQLRLWSPLLLTHADAKGELPSSLFLDADQSYALRPPGWTVEALSADAKDPVAYYLRNIDHRGHLYPDSALVALQAREVLPKLRELLAKTKDEFLQNRLTNLISELESLPAPASRPAQAPSTASARVCLRL